MMNETRHTSRLGMVALLNLTLGVGILFAGCDKRQETLEKPVTKAEAKQPAAVEEVKAPESDAQSLELFVENVALAESFFKWFEIRTKYRESGEQHKKIETALATKEQELLKREPAKTINDSLELVAFHWKLQDEVPGGGKNATFLASWLFHKKGAINFEPDHDVRLVLRGVPDKAHRRHYLSKEVHGRTHYFEFTWSLVPPIDAWAGNGYHLVVNKTYKPLPNIPYRMTTILSEVRKKEDGSYGYVGPYGERPTLGWYADLGE